MSAASAVSRKRRGFTLLHYLVPMPTGRLAAVLSAKAKDFRGGRNGERGEIASSPSGGRVKDEHSPMRSVYRRTCIGNRLTMSEKRPILSDKSLKIKHETFTYNVV